MDQEKKAYRWIVGSAAFAAFMSTLDAYIVSISLPTIAASFHVSVGIASRVTLSFLLFSTSTLLLMGKFVDRFGIRIVFIAGYVIFTAASVLCGVSWSVDMLVLSRCIQGIGGAMLMAAAYAVVPEYVPAAITGWAYSLISMGGALGIAVGSPLGGFITGYLSWPWIFLINGPIGVWAILFVHRCLPGRPITPKPRPWRTFDYLGGVLSLCGLSLLIYGLNMGRELGWTSPAIVACFLVSAAALAFFVMWEARQRSPLLELRLLRDPRFTYPTIAVLLAYVLQSGNAFLLPFYLELVQRLRSEEAGLVLMVWPVTYIITSAFSGKVADRVNVRILCASALLSAAASVFFFDTMAGQTGLVPVMVFLVWLALSYAFFVPSNNKLALGTAAAGEEGAASGFYSTMMRMGMVLGVAVFEAVFSGVLPDGPETGTHLAVPAATLLHGFRQAYALGVVVCLLACLLCAGKK